MTADALSRRIDKWLWCARRFKTRSLAAQLVAEGGAGPNQDAAGVAPTCTAPGSR